MAGLYGAIFAGTLAAIFGGTPSQITGPTAGMTVVLIPIFQEFGLTGLFMASFLAGLFMIALSFLRVGKYVHLISQPVLSGFTNGGIDWPEDLIAFAVVLTMRRSAS